MPLLKLIMSSDKHPCAGHRTLALRTSSNNGDTCCHCKRFSHAEMAALMLITLDDWATGCHCPSSSHAEMAALKPIISNNGATGCH
eukprot:7412537-Karenia_brevis.AAC.1